MDASDEAPFVYRPVCLLGGLYVVLWRMGDRWVQVSSPGTRAETIRYLEKLSQELNQAW